MLDESMYYLTNLFPKRTGLPFVVWISSAGGPRGDLQVRVSRDSRLQRANSASVAVCPHVHVTEGSVSAEDLALLTTWIDLNRDVLARHWGGEIDSADAIDALRRVTVPS